MRILKFTKIDYLKTKSFIWCIGFPLLAIIVMLSEPDTTSFFACIYCLFGGIIVASMPLAMECRANCGFLKMLPARNGEEMKGHFVFSFTILALGLLLSLAAIAVAHVINPAVTFDFPLFYSLMVLGVALIFSAIENFIFCLLPNHQTQAAGILRIVPGFVFFFGAMLVSEHLPGAIQAFINWISPLTSCLILLVCLMIFLLIMQVCVTITNRRDAV